jgi:hypothetical protein
MNIDLKYEILELENRKKELLEIFDTEDIESYTHYKIRTELKEIEEKLKKLNEKS